MVALKRRVTRSERKCGKERSGRLAAGGRTSKGKAAGRINPGRAGLYDDKDTPDRHEEEAS